MALAETGPCWWGGWRRCGPIEVGGDDDGVEVEGGEVGGLGEGVES